MPPRCAPTRPRCKPNPSPAPGCGGTSRGPRPIRPRSMAPPHRRPLRSGASIVGRQMRAQPATPSFGLPSSPPVARKSGQVRRPAAGPGEHIQRRRIRSRFSAPPVRRNASAGRASPHVIDNPSGAAAEHPADLVVTKGIKCLHAAWIRHRGGGWKPLGSGNVSIGVGTVRGTAKFLPSPCGRGYGENCSAPAPLANTPRTG